jgi:hypothetical protein
VTGPWTRAAQCPGIPHQARGQAVVHGAGEQDEEPEQAGPHGERHDARAELHVHELEHDGPLPWGPVASPLELTADLPPELEQDISRAEHDEVANDPHLRSARDTMGYTIRAVDGDIGHLDDYLVDEETWTFRYLVVATRNWWPGKIGGGSSGRE